MSDEKHSTNKTPSVPPVIAEAGSIRIEVSGIESDEERRRIAAKLEELKYLLAEKKAERGNNAN